MADASRPAGVARWFHHDQIDPERERWYRGPVGQDAPLADGLRGATDPRPFGGVHGLFGQPELAGLACPHLHDDEAGRR